MAQPPTNAWCRRMDVPCPDLEALASRKDVNLRDLLIAALLERGAPMALEELATRIAALEGRGTKDRLQVSLVKAWKGTPPLYRDDDGSFGLDPDSPECAYVRAHLYPRPRSEPTPLPPAQPATERLTIEELRQGLVDAYVGSLSAPRLYAAVIDATGRPLTYEEVEGFLAPLLPDRRPLHKERTHHWRGPLVALSDSGHVVLLDAPDQLLKMRAQVRSILRRSLRRQAEMAASRQARVTYRAEERTQRVEAQVRRRAVIHALMLGGDVAALTLLDVATRSLETLIGEEVREASGRLGGYDVLVGLDVRKTAAALGRSSAGARLVDLASAPKSRRLTRQGRTLKIRPDMLIRSSVNLSRALGDRKKMAAYARQGQRTRLVRRMESDAKALYAWYAYGVLHRAVRLRWGFLDEMLPVAWAERGDEHLLDILQAARAGRTVEVVLDTAPGWADPWARACEVLEYPRFAWHVLVAGPRGERIAMRPEIVAARVR